MEVGAETDAIDEEMREVIEKQGGTVGDAYTKLWEILNTARGRGAGGTTDPTAPARRARVAANARGERA